MLRILTCFGYGYDKDGYYDKPERHSAAMRKDRFVSFNYSMTMAMSTKHLLIPAQLKKVSHWMKRIELQLDPTRVEYLPPIPNPGRIFCVGVNYFNRNEEYQDESKPPAYPSIFMRTPQSFVGHNQQIVLPKESEQFDYEGEIAIVIGAPGRRIPRSQARKYMAGLTILNDVSVRDWMRHGKFNVTQGKNWDQSGAMGPWIETDLESLDLGNLRIETRVNGELRQSDTTANMLFPFDYLVSYISTFTQLQLGDIIATGTPTGAGARMKPPRWLKHGDTVDVSVDGIGTLSNQVCDEAKYKREEEHTLWDFYGGWGDDPSTTGMGLPQLPKGKKGK